MIPQISADQPRCLLGVNSGTSADAVDFALIQVMGQGQNREVSLLHSGSASIPAELRKAIHLFAEWRAQDVAGFHHALGVFFGRAARAFLAEVQVAPEQVTALCCHGQTVFHHSGQVADGTLQLGSLSVLAAEVGTAVIGDFRWADLAQGGQGAPVSPFADWVLFGHELQERVILNLGGIANLTWLRPGQDPVAWDSGPANGPLDALAREVLEQPCDRDGALARQGKVHPATLAQLQEDPYFSLPAPKSTGLEHFGSHFLQKLRHLAPEIPPADHMATLVELAAWAVADSLRTAGWQGGEVYAAGGGAHNPALWEALERHLGTHRLHPLENLPGAWRGDLREAVAFALLGDAFLLGETATWPTTTGCRQAAVLGNWCPPARP